MPKPGGVSPEVQKALGKKRQGPPQIFQGFLKKIGPLFGKKFPGPRARGHTMQTSWVGPREPLIFDRPSSQTIQGNQRVGTKGLAKRVKN